MRDGLRCLVCSLLLLQATAIAGEIPGLPLALPPYIERGLDLAMTNDFFGRGGKADDFRTQQIVISARPQASRWSLNLDHSVLTARRAATPGRIDQLSATLGYDVIRDDTPLWNRRLTAGLGLRQTDRLAGERIQNGFHRLVNSGTLSMPYTGTSRTDGTLWVDAEGYRQFASSGSGSWQFGTWWRVNGMLTGDGQLDAGAAAYAVAGHRVVDLWLGARYDWRSGYEDRVLRATAAEEEDIAVVLGLKYGVLVLETVQQLNNAASYGQIRVVAPAPGPVTSPRHEPRFGIETALQLPDVMLHFAGRMQTSLLAGGPGIRESAWISVDYGEPQYGDDEEVYLRTAQFGLGLEWERPLRGGWLAAYGSIGAGWRKERLFGDRYRQGEESVEVGRGVLLGGAGIRAQSTRLGNGWNYRLQFGLAGSLPTGSGATVDFVGSTERIQQPLLNVALGMSFDFE